MNWLLLLITVSDFSLTWLVYWRWSEQSAQSAGFLAYELRFPRDLETEAVRAFVGALSGLLPPWWKRWLSTPVVILETVATNYGISHQLLVDQSHAHHVENMLQAHLPGVRYTPLDAVPPLEAIVGSSYRITTGDRALRVDAPALSQALLTTLQPLRAGEQITVQWVLTPAGPVAPAGHGTSASPWWWPTGEDGKRQDGEAVSALKAKQSGPLLLGSARLAVQAADRAHARSLLHRVESAWHASRAPGVHLRRRLIPEYWVARGVRNRSLPLFSWPLLCNAEELSGLIGIPVEAEQIPGLILGGCRQLAASPLIPTRGVVLALSTFPGSERPIALDVQAQLRHLHAIGPTGVGKSTLLLNLIVQDLKLGRGVTVLDPKGDLVADILERIPQGRERDVIVLDASDDVRPVGINPIRSTSGNGSEIMVENLVGLMHSLWKFSWGPRTDDILRAALMTLALKPGMTLVEVPPLLLEDSFRQRFIGNLDDPVGLESFWGWYHGLSDAERATVVAAPLNKLRAFTMRPRMRRILGQSNPKLDMAEVLAAGKILLVNLASGLLGEDAAALLGALVVAELWHATTARAALPADRRRLHLHTWTSSSISCTCRHRSPPCSPRPAGSASVWCWLISICISCRPRFAKECSPTPALAPSSSAPAPTPKH